MRQNSNKLRSILPKLLSPPLMQEPGLSPHSLIRRAARQQPSWEAMPLSQVQVHLNTWKTPVQAGLQGNSRRHPFRCLMDAHRIFDEREQP